jgi:hypothetical protein
MNNRVIAWAFLALATMLLFSSVSAQISNITAWADKPKYSPGEKGTLNIAFFNTGDSNVTVLSVLVNYRSWQAYASGDWVGNQTFQINVNVSARTVYTTQVSFTVPNDGRAETTSVDVNVVTNMGTEGGVATIKVSETSVYMDQIVTLLTILVVLFIISTVVIAGTIFLSAHRPQVAWKPEEKKQ